MDSRIGYSAAAHIGLLEWQTRLMLPFDIEVGVSDGEPFPASRHRTRSHHSTIDRLARTVAGGSAFDSGLATS